MNWWIGSYSPVGATRAGHFYSARLEFVHEPFYSCARSGNLFTFPMLAIVIATAAAKLIAAVQRRRIATNECLDFVPFELERFMEAHSDIVDKDTLGNLSDGDGRR